MKNFTSSAIFIRIFLPFFIFILIFQFCGIFFLLSNITPLLKQKTWKTLEGKSWKIISFCKKFTQCMLVGKFSSFLCLCRELLMEISIIKRTAAENFLIAPQDLDTMRAFLWHKELLELFFKLECRVSILYKKRTPKESFC